MALNAQLTLVSKKGSRRVALDSFITGPGKTVIRDDEILSAVMYPAIEMATGSAYYKLAQRKALDISVVGVAAWIALDTDSGKIKDVRVALGAVGPTPILAESHHLLAYVEVTCSRGR